MRPILGWTLRLQVRGMEAQQRGGEMAGLMALPPTDAGNPEIPLGSGKGMQRGPRVGVGGSARSGRDYSLWGPFAPGMIPALGASRALQKAHR